MSLSFLYRTFCRVLQLVRLIYRSDTDLAVEVVMLRHEVAVLRRQLTRPALQPADRALLSGLARLLPGERLSRFFVQPSTLLRWHRDLVRRHWTYPHRRSGRPAVSSCTVSLVLRFAKENPAWGYRRIQGELTTLGISVAASSVCEILKRHGDEPSPRGQGPSWAEFLRSQAKGIVACDFFHVDTVLLRRIYGGAREWVIRLTSTCEVPSPGCRRKVSAHRPAVGGGKVHLPHSTPSIRCIARLGFSPT